MAYRVFTLWGKGSASSFDAGRRRSRIAPVAIFWAVARLIEYVVSLGRKRAQLGKPVH